jgi:type III pantothenate kinase
MLLAIDAGNTNLVFALVGGGEIKARWRIATDPRRTADEYAVWLHQLLELEGYAKADVEAVIIGTVVPRSLHNLEVLASKYFHVEPVIAGQGAAAWPLKLDVDEPHNVGADRALNAIAAHAKHEGDLIVIDFGTATTFDVVAADGAYKGGIIAPGINLSPDGDSVIGRTTDSQMLIGIYWGYVAMIEGLAERMKREIGRPATVIATGGLADLFDQHTDVFDAIEPDLTIQGLSLLYDLAATGS